MTTGRRRARGSKDAQFTKRETALRMLASGRYRQAEIATILGVAHGTVRGWSSKMQAGDPAVTTVAKRGRRMGQGAILTAADQRRIIAKIRDKNPRQLKMEFQLWSVGAVMTLIERDLGKTLSESGTRKYLKLWGFTIQRPATRYSRRDDVIIQRWLAEEYPRIAARAKSEGAGIHWLDETGVNNQAFYHRCYALKGETPRAMRPSNREKISLISTVTNQGTMRFSLFEGALKKDTLIRFLENLIAGATQKLYVIMDNLRVHKSVEVQEWAAAHATAIEIFHLPPYAPEHNPDEYLNNDLKQNVHWRSGLPLDKDALRGNVKSHLCHIQKSPAKIMGYFRAPAVQYAA